MKGHKIQAGHPNENGDVEQRNYRIKQAVDQVLMLRYSRDFSTRQEYESFLRNIVNQLNTGRKVRLHEEIKELRELPILKQESFRRFRVRVGQSSTIRIVHNTYSVHSRLIKEHVYVRLYADHLNYGMVKNV